LMSPDRRPQSRGQPDKVDRPLSRSR
jgi:hypothetical protein